MCARPRKTAPNVTVDPPYVSERDELVKTFAPDCINKRDPEGKKTWGLNHAYFCDSKDEPDDLMRARGYEPVLRPDKTHVAHKGDKLWKCPTETWLKKQNLMGKIARERADAAASADDLHSGIKLQKIDE